MNFPLEQSETASKRVLSTDFAYTNPWSQNANGVSSSHCVRLSTANHYVRFLLSYLGHFYEPRELTRASLIFFSFFFFYSLHWRNFKWRTKIPKKFHVSFWTISFFSKVASFFTNSYKLHIVLNSASYFSIDCCFSMLLYMSRHMDTIFFLLYLRINKNV